MKTNIAKMLEMGAKNTFRSTLIVAFLLQSIAPSYAQTVTVDPNAAAANRATLDAAANGVPISNIPAPNSAGVSHGQYTDFNTGPQGLILNNNPALGRSQLGGLIQGNPNLTGGSPARLIINEVTSQNRSALNGALEVNGQAADVIIANPNGINVNGGTFINVPRATITTGRPEFDASGALQNLRIEGGDIAIQGRGLDASGTRQLNLAARQIALEGTVLADELKVSLGQHNLDPTTGNVTAITSAGTPAPAQSLTVTETGSAFAGTVTIVSVDPNSRIVSPDQLFAGSGDIAIRSEGGITLNDTVASGNVDATATEDIKVQGAVHAGLDTTLNSTEATVVESDAAVTASRNVSIEAGRIEVASRASVAAGSDESGAFIANAGTLTLRSFGDAEIGASSLIRGGAALDVLLDGTLQNLGTIQSDQGFDIRAGEAIANSGNMFGDGITLVSDQRFDNETTGLVDALGGLSITSKNSSNAGTLRSADALTLANASPDFLGSFANTGTIESGATLTFFGDQFGSTGLLQSVGALQIGGGTIEFGIGSQTLSDSIILATGTTFLNAGLVAGNGGIELGFADRLTNLLPGSITTNQDIVATVANGTLENAGVISAGNGLTLNADQIDNLANAEITSATFATLTGDLFENLGQVSAGTRFDLTFDTKITNGVDGSLQAINEGLFASTELFENSGLVASGGSIQANVDTLINDGGAFLSLGDLTIEGTTENTRATLVRNDAGNIETLGGTLTILSETLENLGDAQFETVRTAVQHQFRQARPPQFIFNLPRSFYIRFINDAVFDQLDDGGRTQTHVFVPHPDKLNELLELTGKSIDEFTPTDWQRFAPRNQAEFDTDDWVLLVPDEAGHAPPGADAIVIVEEDVLVQPIVNATIATDAGGDIILDVGALTNRFGTIAAAGDMEIDADTVVNEGRDGFKSISVAVNFSNDTIRPLGWFRRGFGKESRGPTLHSREQTFSAPAIIAAGGDLRGTASGSIVLAALPVSDPSELSFGGTSSTIIQTVTPGPNQNRDLNSIGFNPSLFRPASDDSLFLLETRVQFVDEATFFGSEFFLSRLGFSPDDEIKLLGDAYFDAQLVRAAILELTGYRFLDNSITSDGEQLRKLILNAETVATELGLTFGVPLTAQQLANLKSDIVWYVETEFNGRRVLVPQVYLAPNSLERIAATGSTVSAGQNLNLVAPNILIDTAGVQARDAVVLRAAERATSIGGQIVASDIIITGENSFQSITETIGTGDGTNLAGTIIGRKARIEGDNITFDVPDISLTGSDLIAKEDLNIQSARLQISPVAAELLRRYDGDKGKVDIYNRTLIIPRISVGGSANISASEAALIQSAAVKVNENLVIRAGELIIESTPEESRNSGTIYKTGFKEGETSWEYITITQVPTIIEVGGDVHLIAEVGNATIRASKISAGGSANVEAAKVVEFETAENYLFERELKTGQSIVWQSSEDEGKEERVAVHTEIITGNGLNVRGGEGIVVQYRAGQSFDEAIDTLSATEGLAWMAELRERDDIDWQAINEQHREWSEKNQGLSGPAAAVIAIAIAIATQGAGTALAAEIGISNAIAVTGFEVGVTALAQQATISLANNQGNLGAVFDDLTSSQGARAFATAVIAAGLTTGASGALNLPIKPTDLVGRLQVNLVNAGVNTIVDSTIGGESFSDSLIGNVKLAAVNAIGAEVAQEIGDAAKTGQINKAAQLISHAALGCAVGGASGDCKGGALGAFAGEIAAEVYLERQILSGALSDGDIDALVNDSAQVGRLVAGIAAFATERDVNVAASTGATAAENNAAGRLVSSGIKILAKLAEKAKKTGRLSADDLKKIGIDELVGIADDTATLLNPEASVAEKLFAASSLLIGVGKDEAKAVEAFSNNVKKTLEKGDNLTSLTRTFKKPASVPKSVGAAVPSRSVNNIGEFFDTLTGSVFKGASRRTSKVFQGQRVYKADRDIVLQDGSKIRKGDEFYLDGLHKNHLEVFDSNGGPRIKVDLAGNNLGSLPKNRRLK